MLASNICDRYRPRASPRDDHDHAHGMTCTGADRGDKIGNAYSMVYSSNLRCKPDRIRLAITLIGRAWKTLRPKYARIIFKQLDRRLWPGPTVTLGGHPRASLDSSSPATPGD
jgi:hypothetical protein